MPLFVARQLDRPWLTLRVPHDSLLSGPLVHIRVGNDTSARTWSLHRNLLVYHSPVFEQLFGGGGHDGNGADLAGMIKSKRPELHFDFPDAAPEAFELLVQWLYQGRLEVAIPATPASRSSSGSGTKQKDGTPRLASARASPAAAAAADDDDDDDEEESDEARVQRLWAHAFACQQLYTLCERLGLRALKNEAIDHFRRGCCAAGLVPGPEEMIPVYRDTPPGSPFRQLVARIAARQILDPAAERDAVTYRACFASHPDFAVDVVNAMRDGGGGTLLRDPTAGEGCEYHEHAEGERCAAKLRLGNGNGNGILK